MPLLVTLKRYLLRIACLQNYKQGEFIATTIDLILFLLVYYHWASSVG